MFENCSEFLARGIRFVSVYGPELAARTLVRAGFSFDARPSEAELADRARFFATMRARTLAGDYVPKTLLAMRYLDIPLADLPLESQRACNIAMAAFPEALRRI